MLFIYMLHVRVSTHRSNVKRMVWWVKIPQLCTLSHSLPLPFLMSADFALC